MLGVDSRTKGTMKLVGFPNSMVYRWINGLSLDFAANGTLILSNKRNIKLGCLLFNDNIMPRNSKKKGTQCNYC
jgi:hypothetical protein